MGAEIRWITIFDKYLEFVFSGCLAAVGIQHSAQALFALDVALIQRKQRLGGVLNCYYHLAAWARC